MRYKKLIVLFLFSELLFGVRVNSQPAWTIFNSINSPLPENSVRCIAIGSDGKKWIGTDFGLAIYDDVSWTVYYTSNSDLPDNSIRSIAIDSSGIAWIGTFSGGLAKFDGTNWTTYNTLNSDIPDDYVRSLAIDTLGNKWVGTIGGLAYFDDSTWEVYDMMNTNLLSNNMSSLYVNANDNSVIVGTINGGMAYINNTGWTYLNIWNSNLPDNTILGIDKDSSGTPWLATPASGLSAHVGGALFLTMNTLSSAIQSNSLTALCINRLNDNIWIASNDSGVIRKSGLNFTAFNTLNSPMPDNFVQSVKVENNGIIWIGTQTGGLIRLDESLLSSDQNDIDGKNIFIYPNPVSETLNLNLYGINACTIEIIDNRGRCFLKSEMKQASSKNTVDVSTFPTGNYLMKINFKNGNYTTRKFIVLR